MRKQDRQPPKTKKYFRSTKSGAGMTKAGVARYRRENPGSKLKTAVTGKVKPGSKAAKRRKSFCARSAGQMKSFQKLRKILTQDLDKLVEDGNVKWLIPKLAQAKNQKDLVGDCIQMKILETLLELSLRPLRTLVKLWQKLKKSVNHTQEKYKSLRLVNKEPKLWVRQRWLAYLKKVKKQSEEEGKKRE